MGPKHSPEFSQEAVRIVLTSELTRKQVAADFGVGFSTLSRWGQLDRRNPEKPAALPDLVQGKLAQLEISNFAPHRFL